MDRRNFNKNPNHRRNNKKNNDKRNDNNNDKNQKEVVKEHVDEFKEAFVKDKDLEISYIVMEEHYFYAPNERLKSEVVCDSSYLN